MTTSANRSTLATYCADRPISAESTSKLAPA